METIISTDLLELLVLMCSIIIQQYPTIFLLPDKHHISYVVLRMLRGCYRAAKWLVVKNASESTALSTYSLMTQ